jgi:hypothetical protein
MAFAKELEERGKAISFLQVRVALLIDFLIQHAKESPSNPSGDPRINFGDKMSNNLRIHIRELDLKWEFMNWRLPV